MSTEQTNPCRDLVRQFREAHAAFGGTRFAVLLCTEKQASWADVRGRGLGLRQVAQLGLSSQSRLFAYAPVVRGWTCCDAGDGRALTRHINTIRRVGEPWPEPFNQFRKLAALAGSHLPREVRETLPVLAPAGQFLTLMRQLVPPVEVPSDKADVFQAFWPSPFQAAADTLDALLESGRRSESDPGGVQKPSVSVNAALCFVDRREINLQETNLQSVVNLLKIDQQPKDEPAEAGVARETPEPLAGGLTEPSPEAPKAADAVEGTDQPDAPAQAYSRGQPHDLEPAHQLVTLSQAAAVSGIAKRTLEDYLKKGIIPKPNVKGGQGKANLWYWSTLRTALEKYTKRPLPPVFPTSVHPGLV